MNGFLKLANECGDEDWYVALHIAGRSKRNSVLKFVGIDGCKLGWFYVGINFDNSFSVGVIRHIDSISAWLETADLILIDIPIGLPSESLPNRSCDVAARQMIKPRGSTVFPAPARSAISKSSYEAGSAENFRCLGRKLSKQSWAIAGKIKEVDDYVRALGPSRKVREMHPEVAFCGLNGGRPLLTSKKKSDGFAERFQLLQRYYPMTGAVVDAARENTPLKKDLQDDDILDAMVGAVTACRYPNIHTLPENPFLDSEGLPMEMVFARETAGQESC